MSAQDFWELVQESHKKALEQMYWSLLQAVDKHVRGSNKTDMVRELELQKMACHMLMAHATGGTVTFETEEEAAAKDKAARAMMDDTGSEQIDVSDIMQRLGKPKLH